MSGTGSDIEKGDKAMVQSQARNTMTTLDPNAKTINLDEPNIFRHERCDYSKHDWMMEDKALRAVMREKNYNKARAGLENYWGVRPGEEH
jgi:hypothetical protein